MHRLQSTHVNERGSGTTENLFNNLFFVNGIIPVLVLSVGVVVVSLLVVGLIWLFGSVIPRTIRLAFQLDQDFVSEYSSHSGELSTCPTCRPYFQSHFWFPDDSELLGSLDSVNLAQQAEEHWQQVNAAIPFIPSAWG